MTRKARCLGLAAAFFLLLSLLCAGSFTQWNFAGADFGQWKKCLEVMTGFWLLLLMMACVLTALRLPAVDRFFGGLPEPLRSHRTLGIASAVAFSFTGRPRAAPSGSWRSD